jgi:HTH-type transcriptional regulator/antitoxin HigA
MARRTKATRLDETAYAGLLSRILPRPIRTDAENEKAIALLDELDQREKPAPEEALLAELLTILVEDFESKHYSLEPSAPREHLQTLMEDRGLRHKDVWPVFGNKGSASAALNGKRAISKTQAKRLAEFLRVPVELFL